MTPFDLRAAFPQRVCTAQLRSRFLAKRIDEAQPGGNALTTAQRGEFDMFRGIV